jgi:hypothetical protein
VRERPWEIERAVIARLGPPLNSGGNAAHGFYQRVRDARAEFRRRAAERGPKRYEGWLEFRLEDATIDGLLASPNVALLRRYRNGVFHFQRRYFDTRFVGFVQAGEDVVTWVRELNVQFGRFFLEWFEGRRAARGGKALESSDGEQRQNDQAATSPEGADSGGSASDGD